jgi:hypothetical protein
MNNNVINRASIELKNTLDEECRVEVARSTERQRAPEPARPYPVDSQGDSHTGEDAHSVPRPSSGDA